jgi:hypothetical protein
MDLDRIASKYWPHFAIAIIAFSLGYSIAYFDAIEVMTNLQGLCKTPFSFN